MYLDLKTCLSENVKIDIVGMIEESLENTNAILANYPTKNSYAIHIWDEIYKNISQLVLFNTNFSDIESFITRRGPWTFSLFYKDGIVYSLMREARFKEIKKDYGRNSNNTHYAISLAKILNVKLPVSTNRLFYMDEGNNVPKYNDIVDKVLNKIIEKGEIINGFVLILFDADKQNLLSARMVLLDSELEPYAEENLNKYIQTKTSIVVDSVVDYPDKRPADPTMGLKIKAKAQARKANKELNVREEKDIGKNFDINDRGEES